jgi:ABC-2 type transport system permease protein
VALWSLTFVFPTAFIGYLSSAALLERLDGVPLPPWLAWAAAGAGLVVFAPSN